ncbi:MAG: glycosyltransferase family 4 protein [Pseudomonadota bacterium]|nr:glycosyltransferase family 4 protein [Pseudomonadota bacterium]
MSEVILLSHGFQPEYEAGFANGIARNGITVTLVGSDTTLIDRLEPSVRYINLRGSHRTSRLRIEKARNLIRYFFAYCFLLFRHRGTAVHVTGLFSTGSLWISLIEAWVTRLLTGGYILTVHNLLPHDRHTSVNTKLSYCIYRSARYLMVHTHRMRQDLCRYFAVDPDRVVVVEHGIDRLLPDIGGAREMMRAKLGIRPAERVLLFFGAIVRYKGLDVLLRAFALLTTETVDRLVVAGRCRDRSLFLELQAILEAHPRRDAIIWRDGYVDEKEVAPIFHAADVLVMPYRHIDQSGVIFMALATGLRAVVTDVGSLPDYVPGGSRAVARAGDPEALASCIKEVIGTPTGNTIIHGAEQYLWHRTVGPILGFYDRN